MRSQLISACQIATKTADLEARMSRQKLKRLLVFILLIFGTTSAQAEWRTAESPRFIVYADMDEASLRSFTTRLEQFDRLLRGYTNTNAPPAELKVQIFLVADSNEIAEYAGNSGVGGFYVPSTRGPFAVVPQQDLGRGFDRMESESILFHEYTHHFMLQYFATAYPSWYVEGFAEYFMTATFRSDTEVDVGLPPRIRARWFLYGEWQNVERMLSNEHTNTGMTYAQAWALVHLAANNEEVRQMLSSYLTEIVAGQPGSDAYDVSFGNWSRSLNFVLRRYVASNRFAAARFELDPLPDNAITIAPINEQEAYLMMLRGRRTNRAEGALRAATQNFAQYPQSHAELAIFHVRNRDYDEAIESADRALALDPNNIDANVARADAMIGQARASEDDDNPLWEASRSFIIRANNANPNNPDALASYYASFPVRETRPAIAVSALERAYQLMPQSGAIRLIMAEEYLAQERYDQAILAANPLAQTPHEDASTERARAIIATARNPEESDAGESEQPDDPPDTQ
jgi:tetratricopeptide (TPR) repeat protein